MRKYYHYNGSHCEPTFSTEKAWGAKGPYVELKEVQKLIERFVLKVDQSDGYSTRLSIDSVEKLLEDFGMDLAILEKIRK